MLWWHSWEWWFSTYGWLQDNNLWKSVVAFGVTLLLGVGLTSVMRPWNAWKELKKHRELQEKIADRLDTNTPGGLADLMQVLHRVLTDLDEGEAPDDSGSDDEHKGQPFRPHGGKSVIARAVSETVHNTVRGEGNANHR